MQFKISNPMIAGLGDSIRASKFPMTLNPEKCEPEITEMTQKLGRATNGSGHDCFLKGIIVQADITAPQYWWLQFGRYHFADIVSSQSKMHRITKMDLAKQCNEYVEQTIIAYLQLLVEMYKHDPTQENFQKIIANCPMGLMLTARITTNYLQLKTIYYQRKHHKLKEWEVFCNWIKNLPYFEQLVLGNESKEG